MPTKPPVIVTARKPRARRTPKAAADLASLPSRIVGAGTLQEPSMTAAEREEHQRRGEPAKALFRELVRRATGKEPQRDF